MLEFACVATRLPVATQHFVSSLFQHFCNSLSKLFNIAKIIHRKMKFCKEATFRIHSVKDSLSDSVKRPRFSNHTLVASILMEVRSIMSRVLIKSGTILCRGHAAELATCPAILLDTTRHTLAPRCTPHLHHASAYDVLCLVPVIQ